MSSLREEIERARSGDLQAFSVLVRRFQDGVVAYAFSRVRDLGLAEDAAQETFLEAYGQLGALREPAAFAVWLRRITLKQCDRISRRKRVRSVALDEALTVATGEPDPSLGVEQGEVFEHVRAAVASLPEKEREIVLLFYFAEYSHDEIAAFLEQPVGTVKSRLHSARKHLEERMDETIRDAFREQRPSRDDAFAHRVLDVLRAAAAGDHARIDELTRAEPELANARGAHPNWGGEPQTLQVAAEWGRLEVVELLLDRGADPDARQGVYEGWTPLHLALHRGHRQVVDLLRARGATVDPCAAAALGDLRRVEALSTYEIGFRGPNGATPLHFAASIEVARALLKAGAAVRAVDKHGNTPERWLAWYADRRPVAHFLLETARQDPDVFLASALGEADVVREHVRSNHQLLTARSRPYDAVARLSRGATPLHVAAIHGHTNVITTLLDLGAAVDGRCADGTTALHQAAGAGARRAVELLLERGASLDAVDVMHGSTPLGWAEFQGRTEITAVLRERGARC